MKLSVVIPVYNENNTILPILQQVKKVPLEKEIIIVDDGSTDGTREILKKISDKDLKVFFNKRNRGKGYSIRRGFKHISGDIVIIQDADLEYYPDEYPKLIEKIIERKADVVYGTRFLGSRRIFHFYHYLGNKILNLVANFLFNANLSDLMTCYKAFRTDALRQLRLHADRFGIEAEITAQIFKRRLRVYEVPISYNGRDYDEGKKITWKDFFRCLYWLVKGKFTAGEIDQDTLYRMKSMVNNNRWLFNQIKPYLGERVLEVGSGIGNISRLLISSGKELILTDVNQEYLNELRQRFGGNPRVKILKHNILSTNLKKLINARVDTVVCLNVLEHLEDDQQALGNMKEILVKNGRLILVVPAMKWLYGSLDENLDHYRRYEKEELGKKLKEAKLKPQELQYHNFLATFGWFINSRLLKKKIISSAQIKLLDKIIPILSKIEEKFNLPWGLSLVAITRKV